MNPVSPISPPFGRRCFATLLLCLCLTASVSAQQTDTLSFYRSHASYVYFRNPSISLQAARFVNPAPGYVKSITVALGGKSNDGTVRLRIFGHEGGSPAPILEQDLIEPITLKKSQGGFESITVELPERPFLSNNQFFIAFDRIDSGVVVLSDRSEIEPFCASSDDLFYNQLLKRKDGSWYWEKFSYVIDVVMDYPNVSPRYGMGDMAVGLGIEDTVLRNRSLAWADVDGNGFLDLLWDGRLYLNREGRAFESVGDELGIEGKPSANLFLDANNDGEIDILFLGFEDSSATTARLFLGSGGLGFTTTDISIPSLRNPTSFSVADVDGDGFLDVFVGQGTSRGDSSVGISTRNESLLLLNSGGRSFIDAGDRLPALTLDKSSTSNGSQFLDADNDGDPDLYVARRYPNQSLLMLNDGSGRFASSDARNPGLVQELGAGSGGDWKDYDNDGDLDLLYPRLIHPYLRKYRDMNGSGLYTNPDETGETLERLSSRTATEPIEYEERHAGGVWGDVDNDGLLDAFFTTEGYCRFAELYTQNTDHSFTFNTFDYGLHWSSAGEDAIWIDFDNDGWLDLCAVEWNRLRLYKNAGEKDEEGNYVEIEPTMKNGSYDVGASVTVHAGDVHIGRHVVVGRGILMGDPPRLHYGLGREQRIDSVEVEWSDGTRETFYDVEANSIAQLVKGSSGRIVSTAKASISAVPNPFKDQLQIYFSVPERQNVRLEIYDQSGVLVATIIDDVVEAGSHTVTWEARDGQGLPVPSGLYIYRLRFDEGELNGQAMLTR